MGLEEDLFGRGEGQPKREGRKERAGIRRSPLTTTAWSRFGYRVRSKGARITTVTVLVSAVSLGVVRVGPGALAMARDHLAADPVPAQTVQVEVVQVATPTQLEDLKSQIARGEDTLSAGRGLASDTTIDALRTALNDAEEAQLWGSAVQVTQATLTLVRAIDQVAGEQAAAQALSQQQASDQAANEAALRAQEKARTTTPNPRPATTPTPTRPTAGSQSSGVNQPRGPAAKTASQTVTCAGVATITFTASGSGNVTLSVSGGGSSSGAGAASMTVSGAGPFTATGTAAGLSMTWSSSGSSCS